MKENNNDILNFEITREKINYLIDTVISDIPKYWPNIYKIRYIYLEIGKKLYKDADFFFSADGKLGEENLSIPDIKQIYNSDLGRIVNDKYLRVICKSASYILKKAYEKIGIKSELVETNTTITAINDDEEFLINHWLLAIHDGEKTYFATLTPDLPYIQMNMDTRHFASDIPYTRDFNGNVMQLYKGEEIKHTVLSREELKKIDLAIGYINKSYHYNDKAQIDNEWFSQYDNASFYMLRDCLRDNRLFYELEIESSSFYRSLTNFMGQENKIISFIDTDMNSLTSEDWNCWLKIMCNHVLGKIEHILGRKFEILPDLKSKYWNYDSWLFNLCSQIQYDLFLQMNNNQKDNFSELYIKVEDFKYNKWSKMVKNRFGKNKNKFDYNNILLILDKMNALVNCINSNRKNGNFNELFSSLAFHFINPNHLYENNISEDGYLSNYYIANKFDKVFRKVFNCNELVTDFNKMGYSEKVTIIREILTLMFPEITKSNSSMLKEYNDDYSAIFNRIQLYPIKDKEDGFYSILFNILGDSKNTDYYFFYNAKKNIFKISNALDIYNDYIVVSNRMKNRISIEDLEKIDELGKRSSRKL